MRLYTFKDKPKDKKTHLLEIDGVFIRIWGHKEVRVFAPKHYYDILVKSQRLHLSGNSYPSFNRNWYNINGFIIDNYSYTEHKTVLAYYDDQNIPLKYKLSN